MEPRFEYLAVMIFWIILAVMTAAVAAILLYPLLRGAKTADDSHAGEAAVYRDQLRELDVIAAVIIGGASIFGGYGSIIGALAGAAVITLLRALLSLQIILPDSSSLIMPQHWVNVFIGLILIVAVLGDIWLRQEGLIGRIRHRLAGRRESHA